jgi:S-adenosylmethionine:diacylglycerol 3-amino-3-carboxypropyl transferase
MLYLRNVKNRTSQDYRFSVDLNDVDDVITLGQLKALVKQTNKTAYKKQRVVLKGRLGSASNPARPKYRGNPCYTVAVADAEYFDVYVYNK